MTNTSRHLFIIVVALAACLALAGCGGNAPYSPIVSDTTQAPDLLLLTDIWSVTVEQGAVAEFRFVLKAVGSFASTVKMSVTGLPAQWELLPSDSLVPSTAGTQMTLKVNTSGVAPGNYQFTVGAHSGNLTRLVGVTLKVKGLQVSISPAQATVTPTQPAVFTVTVAPLNGHTDPATLTVSGLPLGFSSELSPGVVQFSGATPKTATLTVYLASIPTKRGRVSEGIPFSVTATSATASATTTAQVFVELTGGVDGIIR